jgi:heterodisulfide reductase subunit A-like polyferredoxin
MSQYSVKLGQQKEKVLFIDGVQSICPFSAPLPFQGSVGQIQIMRMPCSTQCPHAFITDNQYHINCGHSAVTFNLESIEQDSTPSGGKIIGI